MGRQKAIAEEIANRSSWQPYPPLNAETWDTRREDRQCLLLSVALPLVFSVYTPARLTTQSYLPSPQL